ncbi:MAG TPA: DUF3817 domain-containing protein [Gammaproteobacteria bacterium]|nr:DUF3817 domain-containing protein [Gammaproteobacteria bacterium]
MNTIRRLRYIGLIEGVSSLLLFFVAMPLKYLNDMPQAVTVVGAVHGFLFILYMLALGQTMIQLKRSLGWAAKVFIAAIFPFGPFFIEPALRREQVKLENKTATSSYNEQ